MQVALGVEDVINYTIGKGVHLVTVNDYLAKRDKIEQTRNKVF